MQLTLRSTPVLEVRQGARLVAVVRARPANPANLPPVRPRASFHYHGIPPPGRIPWLAMLVSAGLHAMMLLGPSHHAPPKKTAVVEDIPADQIMMMSELKDPEEEKPVELNDDEPAAPSVSVPTLMDVPVDVPLNASFVQQLDLTIPLKSDPTAGKLFAIPVNIRHGRPDDGGIKNLFNLSELDRPPEPIVQPPADYPFEMKREGIAGRVRTGFIVDSQGNVILPYVISSTNSGFERSAIDAVRKWKFRPGMKNGRKVNTRVEQPLDFKVDEKDGR